MNKIKLIADSTCDITEELEKLLDVEVAPLHVTFENDDKTYTDRVDITLAELAEHVKKDSVLPKTSSRSIEYHEELFQKWLDLGYDIIYVCISSDLSSTFNNALIAKCEVSEPKRVQVIDSRSLTSCQTILLIKLKELIDKGEMTVREIREYAEKNILPGLRCNFAVPDVKYLAKGGRCSMVKAWLSNILSIKPVISMENGKLVVAKKIMGTIKNAMDYMFDQVAKNLKNIDPEVLFITECFNEEVANYIIKKIKDLKYFKRIDITKCGTIVGSHCGPGTIGLLYLEKVNK